MEGQSVEIAGYLAEGHKFVFECAEREQDKYMSTTGKLYGIGVGPGDPELLTLKAARLIQECDRIVVPGMPYTTSKAYQIALAAVPKLAEKPVTGVRVPMSKDEQELAESYAGIAQQMQVWLDKGQRIAYLTLGDVTVYSTYLPIHRMIKEAGYETELVSGVTSFCASAARLDISLGEREQPIHILPASYPIEQGLALAGTKVLMKAGKQMEQVQHAIRKKVFDSGGEIPWDIAVAENCGMEEERIGYGIESVRADSGYLTLTILKDRKAKRPDAGYAGQRYEGRKKQEEIQAEPEPAAKPVVYVVGIGPGGMDYLTMDAKKILDQCDTIVGYTVYAQLLQPWFPDKDYRTTPMTQEENRCRLAFKLAMEGRRTALVCSGDSGIYGMAGLMYELSKQYPECDLQVVPGVTAAVAGGALLGAPLGHDLAFISLSDRLTPWELIQQRLAAAAKADFVICLYNPSSKGRPDYLHRACGILLETRSRDTVCGLVCRIGRDGQETRVVSLGGLENIKADMFATVFIGNSQTKEIQGHMVTPRGYRFSNSE